MTVSSSGLSLGLRAKWSAIISARPMSRVRTALHSSKLLKSFEMPMLASISASVMRFVPSGSETVSLHSSFEILAMSVPKWSVSIDSAFWSIVSPRPLTNCCNHEAIS